MSFALIDVQRTAIIDRIKIDKDSAYILYLVRVAKQQIRKIRRNIKLYNFVVIS
jgi:hypothetical protein